MNTLIAIGLGFLIGYVAAYDFKYLEGYIDRIKKKYEDRDNKEEAERLARLLDAVPKPKAEILDPDSVEFQTMMARQEHEASVSRLNPK